MPFGDPADEPGFRSARRVAQPWIGTGLTVLLLAGGFGRRRYHRALQRQLSTRGEIPPRATSPEQASRGRLARTPSEIPAKGWKDILLRVYRSLSSDRIVEIAAGVTYYAVLAIFPALAAFVSIYGLFAEPGRISDVLQSLSSVLPGATIDLIGDEMHRLASQPRATLGATFLVSLAISLWSANSGMKSIFDALNIVYHEKDRRGFFKLNAVSLMFTVIAMAGGLVVLALVAILPAMIDRIASFIGFGEELKLLVTIARWPVLLVLISVAIACIYRYGPSRETAQWRWLSWGSLAASLLWLAASMLFSWYASSFASYNRTYGSLSAVIVFMTWLWISTIVILLGAELDAEMEHQTARDTTTGHPRPLGERGAHMADTVGAAQS